ncbi:hypothetical protein H696_01793 [Fonticula alba]|uniref:ATPase n=1 Tax=Fonticula alba TaxID=691883 RepID=A0A058ZEQ0_FONAL|nr:hypothetical protein H696_01793 [Fonticula alba]KCV72398.1 hypothetical protein H696_01793 [Fonticula alba]|eukprot:XP_009493976.1 hypothetical protein H696_01793 [Fonticula alba]
MSPASSKPMGPSEKALSSAVSLADGAASTRARPRRPQGDPAAGPGVSLSPDPSLSTDNPYLEPTSPAATSNALVRSTSIKSASFHVPRPVWARIYTLPYATLYLIAAGLYAAGIIANPDVWLLLGVAMVFGHVLLILSCQWSISLRVRVLCREVTDPYKAVYIRVEPVPHKGKPTVCPLLVDTSTGQRQLYFVYQLRKFVYHETHKYFYREHFETSRPLHYYRQWRGYSNELDVFENERKWGQNTLAIPQPTFLELFKEHSIAPFFVFQVFCVVLYMFDDYWYFSLFTLFMLVTFEATVVSQRLKNFTELRNMSPKPFPVNAFRFGQWVEISSSKLIPGDIISIVRSENDRGVPCDVLLLDGTCIVNEAMLTGESVPQPKESLAGVTGVAPGATADAAAAAAAELLDLRSRHRALCVFAGTKVVQAESAINASIETPPDGGSLGFVLRTGFNTYQGKLIRTIASSTERVSANSAESLFFILFLMVFAVSASVYVWMEGIANDRDRYKLLLNCILIVTSVIPPELPMELALAVNQSLVALTQKAIFCTEPFRIPLAGKLDICCFDKTGTLTTDELTLEGVALPSISSASNPLESLSSARLAPGPASAPSASSLMLNADLFAPGAPTHLTPVAGLGLHPASLVLASCHSLSALDPKTAAAAAKKPQAAGPNAPAAPMRMIDCLVGDPLERAMLASLEWNLLSRRDDTSGLVPPGQTMMTAVSQPEAGGRRRTLRILRRFAFSSAMKRMATVSLFSGDLPLGQQTPALDQPRVLISVKGAAEVIGDLLADKPEWYDRVQRHYARQGRRVLALAYRFADDLATANGGSMVSSESSSPDGGSPAGSDLSNEDVDDNVAAGNGTKQSTGASPGSGTKQSQQPQQQSGFCAKTVGARVAELTRDQAESDLLFAGFLVCSTALKPDAAESIRLLRESSHRCVMITGDSALTGAHVAREVGIVARPAMFLEEETSTVGEESTGGAGPGPGAAALSRLVFVDEEDRAQPVDLTDPAGLERIFYEYDVCVSGGALGHFFRLMEAEMERRTLRDLAQRPSLARLLAHFRVFARTSPEQKERILTLLKTLGYVTLMCGDGTNDVGALKQAHVGVALLDGRPEDLKLLLAQMRAQQLQRQRQALAEHQRRIAEARQRLSQASAAGGGTGAPRPSLREVFQIAQSTMESAEAGAGGGDDPFGQQSMVRLGDASIAAPFTSKLSHVKAICDVVRQGRATLVTTMQMYTILALNSLISAHSLSVLYLAGIKFSDVQYTISGILLSVCFLSLSRAKPAENLSRKRPQANIFNFYIILSILGQFAVHMYCMISVTNLAETMMAQAGVKHVINLETPFEPNLLNNGIYLISLAMQVSTFAINYQGRPFRESIYENRPLFLSLAGVFGLCIAAASGFLHDQLVSPDGTGASATETLADWLQLVPFPAEFRQQMMRLIAIDLVGAWLVERVCNFLFADNKPRRELRLDHE